MSSGSSDSEGEGVKLTPGNFRFHVKDFYEGRHVCIAGRVRDGPERMTINFLDSDGNILLHYDTRFDLGDGENVDCICFNTCIGGDWDSEERVGGIPYYGGRRCHISIRADDGYYCIKANHRDLMDLPYRGASPSDVKEIEIKGDIDVYRVKVKN